MMSNAKSPRSKWLMFSLAIAAIATISVPMNGQDVPAVHVGYQAITGVPQDWSHHHVVFSNPGSEEEAIKAGRYAEWLQVVKEPRYVMQQMRRNSAVQGPSADDVAGRRGFSAQFAPVNGIDSKFGPRMPNSRFTRPTFQTSPLKRDWNTNLTASTIMPNTYPAKFSFSTTGTPSCANDFVIYPTGATGAATAATIVAYNNIYPGATAPGCGSTTPETVYWAYNTGAGAVTTSPVFSLDGSEVAYIQSNGTTASLVLAKWHAGPAGRTLTGVLTATSPEVTVSAGTFTAADVGAQITGTGIPVGDTISQVLSATTANLAAAPTAHASETLTVVAEAVLTPGVPPTVTAANYNACTAPCMFSVALSGNPNDTFSSPFYDYTDDVLYVGDNASKLHKFTGVFNGTPTEATPVTLNATSFTVASPIYDSLSGCVFVGDSEGNLYSVASGRPGPVCTGSSFALNATSEVLGNGAANEGIFDAPLVDQTAGTVYAFVADSITLGSSTTTGTFTNFTANFTFTGTNFTAANVGQHITGTCIPAGDTVATVVPASHTGTLSAATTFTCGTETVTLANVIAGDEAVVQFPTSFGAAAAPSDSADLGTGGANYWLFSGSFDNTYYSSGTPSTPSGNIYVIGNNGGTQATLYRVPITSNAIGTPVATVVGSTRHGWGSPVTEFFNTTNSVDDIYFSVNRGSVTGCTNATGDGCIIAYNVTSGAPVLAGATNFTFPNATTTGCWGTSAFIIDNGTSSTDTSNVYFEYFGGNTPSTLSSVCTTVTTSNTNGAYSESQGATF